MDKEKFQTIAVNTAKTLFWVSWTYPLLRIWLYIPYALLDGSLTYKQAYYFKEGMRALHGGRDVSYFLMSRYFYAYLILSAVIYLAWHYRAKLRVSWKVRILLPLLFLLNIMTAVLQEVNVYLHLTQAVQEAQQKAQEATQE